MGCANAEHRACANAAHRASASTGSNYGTAVAGGAYSTLAARGFSTLKTDQWNSLLNILNNQSNTNKPSDKIISKWILDSGCLHYMTGRRDLFKNILIIASYTIELSNRVEVVTTKQGSVALSSNFVIGNVLFILELK